MHFFVRIDYYCFSVMHNEILSKCITNFPNMNYVFVMFYNIFSIFCTLDMHFFNMSHFKNTYIFFTTYMYYIIANCVRYFLQFLYNNNNRYNIIPFFLNLTAVDIDKHLN